MERQKKEEIKLIKIEKVKKWEVVKNLNKRKVRGCMKYLVQWKRFIVEHDSWNKKKDLINTKKVVIEFKK